MLTESSARTKWCPFSRDYTRAGADGVPVTVNRSETGLPESGTLCIASNCMAWRKVDTASFKAKAEAEFRKSGQRLQSDTGYCGLAGPEPT